VTRRNGAHGEIASDFGARNATRPANAILNYAYAVILGRITRAIIGKGLDPCFGFLHDSRKQGRVSLSYDVLEFHRPGLTRAIFEWASARTFVRSDFGDFDGVIRLEAKLARDVAAFAIKMVPVKTIVESIDDLISMF